MEKIHKPKKVFVEGPISPDFVSKSIASHQSKTNIGAHAIFLGQIRADQKETGLVSGIEYTAYEEMAERHFTRSGRPHLRSLNSAACIFTTAWA
jgi:molybdopterin synthase catalytic subunit